VERISALLRRHRDRLTNQTNTIQTNGGFMRQRRVATALAIPLVFAFVAASCGSDDSSTDTDTDTETTEEETTEDTTDDGGEETEDTTPAVTAPDVDDSVAENTEEIAYGGSITIGLEAEAPGLRPWEDSCSSPCYHMMQSIYDPLMEQAADGTYQGFLAEGIESNEDFTVWTLTLRPDVSLHNGTPVTAQTIADMFPIQQAGTASSSAIASAKLTAVAALDDLTVEYTLSAPFSAFPSFLSGAPLGYVFDPAAAAADSADYAINPIGTGPFVISSRDIDNETIVERNPDYWFVDEDGNQLPYLDSISFRPIPDEGTRLDALISGTTNAMMSLRQGTIRDARAESGIELIEFQGNNTGGGMYNTAIPPYDDVRVRKGLSSMNDQERVIAALGGEGISIPTTQFFSNQSPWWTQEAADAYTTFDFEGGVALLQEYIADPARSDGKAPGEPIDVELSCPPDPTLIAAMQVIEQVWTGSGLVNVSLTQFDQATHINNALSDVHKAHCWRWGGEGDPATSLNPFVAPAAESVANFPNYDDPEMQAWAAEANATDDFETRKELYGLINTRINELNLTWYSGGTAVMVAHAPGIAGWNSWTLPGGVLGSGIAPEARVRYHQVFFSE
jgi:peptide/nickel transport system substrate-binding protein